jgi:acetylglutamate/LysW-gamma-L-alpha-aminoadipate kinase
MAAKEALDGGAGRVVIADANVRDPVVAALGGEGTTIERSALGDAAGGETDEADDGGAAETEGGETA